MEQTYPIIGIPVESSQPIPTRQEITSWYGNGLGYHVSLFMQALTAFMEIDIEERLSYFQVAGTYAHPESRIFCAECRRNPLLPSCWMGWRRGRPESEGIPGSVAWILHAQ